MSTTSVNSSSAIRVSGLASGLDTESMVKKMMTSTQARIDKVGQDKQTLEWKQEEYRTIISKLKSFQEKFFSTSSTSTSSTLSSGFYNSKKVSFQNTSDTAYVGISAPATTDVSDVTLSNIKVATKSTAKTAATVSQQINIGFDSGSAPIDLTGKSFELTLDGVTKTISFSKSYDTAADLSADIKNLTDSAFGIDRLSVSMSGNNIVINTDGVAASLASSSTNDALIVSGLSLENASTSRIDLTKSIADNSFATAVTGDNFAFTINGKSFTFTKDSTINSIINTINTSSAGAKLSYSSITDKFSLTSTTTGSSGAITLSDQTGNFLSSIIGTLDTSNYTQGADASVYINGTKVTRSQNTFTMDGVTYSLKANTTNTIEASITTDVDAAITNIKAFVSDYNDLLETMNSKISETKFRDYPPLTDEQKSSMKDSEITAWEAKAKSGLLKNDLALGQLLSSLKQTVYLPVKNLSDNAQNMDISMYKIGIATESYQSKGKLTIDETKLRVALTEDPDKVAALFTQKSDKIYLPTNTSAVKMERYNEEGIMNRFSDVLSDSVRTTLGGGTLLQIAGYTGSSTETQNNLSKQMTKYETKLTQLLDNYSSEENRYYQQFTTMERYISQMNQQSSWLSNSLSSNG